jgi:high-affinity nickel permease
MRTNLCIIGLGGYLLAGAVAHAQGFNQGLILPFDTATPFGVYLSSGSRVKRPINTIWFILFPLLFVDYITGVYY